MMGSCKQAFQEPDTLLRDTLREALSQRALSEGQLIFRRQCGSCHAPPHKHVKDGNNWQQIWNNLPSPKEVYLVRFISDSKALKASGDAHANELEAANKIDFEHQFQDSLPGNDMGKLMLYIENSVSGQNFQPIPEP